MSTITINNLSAKANIFAAGMTGAPDLQGGGGLTPEKVDLGRVGNRVVTFPTVSGEISGNPPGAGVENPNDLHSAEGDDYGQLNTNIVNYNHISGIVADLKCMFLTGVFLRDGAPPEEIPDRLHFMTSAPDDDDRNTVSQDFSVLAPKLNQTFLIGNGRQGGEAGAELRRFVVPRDARWLYLGFADANGFGSYAPNMPPGYYDNNTGQLSVTVNVGLADSAS